MTLDPVEQRLACYSPSGPPPELRDEILDAVAARIACRRTTKIFAGAFGALLLSGVLAQVVAGSTYQQAMRLANGRSRSIPRSVMVAYAAGMGIHVPNDSVSLRRNGG